LMQKAVFDIVHPGSESNQEGAFSLVHICNFPQSC
jgi:hypothetical protein